MSLHSLPPQVVRALRVLLGLNVPELTRETRAAERKSARRTLRKWLGEIGEAPKRDDL